EIVAGGSFAGTIVDSGTALGLQSDLQQETVVLNGNGIQPPFNGHNTGALRNISNNNTFTGTLILNTNTTVGDDSGTSLTVGTKNGFTGTIGDNNAGHNLTKELTGTLILASANTYGGITFVDQGVVQVQHALGLGSNNQGTQVLDGAQLQLQTPTSGPN